MSGQFRHTASGHLDDPMPVTGGDTALRPALDGLRGQAEGSRHTGAASEVLDHGRMEIHEGGEHGGGVPPRQGVICPARRERYCLINWGMPNKTRPMSYKDLTKEIGQRIRWARELVEPNRAEFARAMGVDRSTIRDIESGRRTPSIFNIIEISHRLRVSEAYILYGSLRDVDGELAGKLALRHPELVGGGPSSDTPDRGGTGNTSPRPRKQDQLA